MSFTRAQAQGSSGSSGTSFSSGNFASPVTAGNFIIATISWRGSGAISSVTDTLGNSAPGAPSGQYLLVSGPTQNSSSTQWQAIYIATNIAPGTDAINVVITVSGINLSVQAIEYKCSAGSGVVVRNVAGNGGNTGNSTAAVSGAVTAQPGDLQYGGGFAVGQISAPGSGYTLVNNQSFWFDEELLSSAGGSVTATFTVGNNNWNANLAVIGPPGGGISVPYWAA